jgi:hypothetical protein
MSMELIPNCISRVLLFKKYNIYRNINQDLYINDYYKLFVLIKSQFDKLY